MIRLGRGTEGLRVVWLFLYIRWTPGRPGLCRTSSVLSFVSKARSGRRGLACRMLSSKATQAKQQISALGSQRGGGGGDQDSTNNDVASPQKERNKSQKQKTTNALVAKINKNNPHTTHPQRHTPVPAPAVSSFPFPRYSSKGQLRSSCFELA